MTTDDLRADRVQGVFDAALRAAEPRPTPGRRARRMGQPRCRPARKSPARSTEPKAISGAVDGGGSAKGQVSRGGMAATPSGKGPASFPVAPEDRRGFWAEGKDGELRRPDPPKTHHPLIAGKSKRWQAMTALATASSPHFE